MSASDDPNFPTEAKLDEAIDYLDETGRHTCVMLNIIREDIETTPKTFRDRFNALDNRYHNYIYTLNGLKGNVTEAKNSASKYSPHSTGFVPYDFSMEMEDANMVQETFDVLLEDVTILKESMEKEKPEPDNEEAEDEEPLLKKRKTQKNKDNDKGTGARKTRMPEDNDEDTDMRKSASGGKHYVRSHYRKNPRRKATRRS